MIREVLPLLNYLLKFRKFFTRGLYLKYVPFLNSGMETLRSAFRACALFTYMCWQAPGAITETFHRVNICFWVIKIALRLRITLLVKFGSLIRFLSAKHLKSAKIYGHISEIYEQHYMTGRIVRKWVRAFKDGRTNIHDEERSCRASVIAKDLVQNVD